MFEKALLSGAVLVILVLLALTSVEGADPPRKVLVFSKTAGFRHDSIPDGIAAIQALSIEKNFATYATEDAAIFSDSGSLRTVRSSF